MLVKKQLQGISLILFGIILEIYAMIDPWVPIFEGVLTVVSLYGGVVSGIVGLIFSFKSKEQ